MRSPRRLAIELARLAKWLGKVPWIRRLVSRLVIEHYARATTPRPRPFSCAADYTSWPGLVDRGYSGRHLPVRPAATLPPEQEVLKLYMRSDAGVAATDTNVLFAFFAQWFTDSFLRTARVVGTDRDNWRKNESNHEIDLCQIYGLGEAQTNALRDRTRGQGQLKSQMIDGQEYPPFLFERKQGALRVKDEFTNLHPGWLLDVVLADVAEPAKEKVFAVGLEHGNSVIGHSIMNTLFVREHNRVAKLLAEDNPPWDDDRVFQTTRNILIVMLLKIIIEEYIVHISPFDFPLQVVPFIAEGKKWNKSNRIAIEFDLLYRWHQLVPNEVADGELTLKPDEFRNNNPLVFRIGVDRLLQLFTRAPAGRIGLFNTPTFLAQPRSSGDSVEQRTIRLMREARLETYNAYRVAFGLRPAKSFEDVTRNEGVANQLRKLYGTVDQLEWYVGIFAEDYADTAMMGELLTTMVGYDAFTQALTNPLLSRNVFNERTFTARGLREIGATGSLQDIVNRNTVLRPRVSFSYK